MRRPACAAWALAASAALAQEAPPAPGPGLGDAAASPGAQRPLWELGLGVAGLSLPDYRGSDQRSGYVLPLPYVVYRGTFLRADRDGARAVLVDAPRLEVDLSVAASVPTRSRDNGARQGMDDLAPTVELGPNANFTLLRSDDRRAKLDLRLPLRAAVSVERSPRHVGNTFSPHLNLDLARVLGGWNVGLLAGPLYGDRRYHQYYYGVDARDATPQRSAYRAHGGYGGWQALAAASRRFGDTWVGAFVRYDSVRGAVFDDSPLVRRDSGFSVGIGVSWVLWKSAELVASNE